MKQHKFKNGYTKPFRANCKKCGKKKQDTIHDLTFYTCPDCGCPEYTEKKN